MFFENHSGLEQCKPLGRRPSPLAECKLKCTTTELLVPMTASNLRLFKPQEELEKHLVRRSATTLGAFLVFFHVSRKGALPLGAKELNLGRAERLEDLRFACEFLSFVITSTSNIF